MIKHYFILFLTTSTLFSFAQDTDSLMAAWKDKKASDSLRIEAPESMIWDLAFSDQDSSIVLARLGLSFAKKMNGVTKSPNEITPGFKLFFEFSNKRNE